MNNNIFEICAEYAKILCAKRALERAERMLLEWTPEEALGALDTIKKILEIDTKVEDPNVVLMRASVVVNEEGEVE